MMQISDHFNQEIYEEIVKIWQATNIYNPARSDDFKAIQQTLDNGGKILVAKEDIHYIGTVWITHDFRRAYVHHMAVLPKYQGLRYGQKILEKALDFCQKLGYQVKLEVHTDNKIARKLYKSYGFKTLSGYLLQINRNVK